MIKINRKLLIYNISIDFCYTFKNSFYNFIKASQTEPLYRIIIKYNKKFISSSSRLEWNPKTLSLPQSRSWTRRQVKDNSNKPLNKRLKWIKKKSANSNKHRLIRNWYFLNWHPFWFSQSWQKSKTKK